MKRAFKTLAFTAVFAFVLMLAPAFAMAQTVEVLAEGSFIKKAVKTSGTYRIVSVDGDLRLELGDDFRTRRAPDLQIFLATHSLDAATGRNATASTSLRIDDLTSRKGAQTYDLPDDLDLAAFNSVLIHCVQYTKLFAAAPLIVSSD